MRQYWALLLVTHYLDFKKILFTLLKMSCVPINSHKFYYFNLINV